MAERGAVLESLDYGVRDYITQHLMRPGDGLVEGELARFNFLFDAKSLKLYFSVYKLDCYIQR